MCDDWLTGVQVPMTREQFQLLPRNPAYAYDYHEGTASLRPRPRYYHAVLPLAPAPVFEAADEKAVLRPLRDTDWELAPLFADAFRDQPPFGHLLDEPRQAAGATCLAQTRGGSEGPLIQRASYLAVDAEDRPRGAILITLFPEGDPSSIGSYHWATPAPPDAVERRLGRPHITWIFVAHGAKGLGLGTALLRASVAELRSMGFRELSTTFMLGNTSSLLWHWRMGFRLVAYPFSRRTGWFIE
jgi:ribosomal protein S18 acetylase RimI-like enzyme